MKKKIFGIFILFAVSILVLAGCGTEKSTEAPEQADETGKLQIVATLFPQYDFAKTIAGDKAEVTMLLPPGAESHSYEPSPADIITVSKSNVFIYTGKYMETWAESIIDVLPEEVCVLDVSEGIDLAEYNSHEEHEADEDHDGHDHGVDPHVWTDPVLAMKMAENIYNALCEIDSENADYYKENYDAVISKLEALDTEFREIVSASDSKFIVFGGRFAFNYFVKEYGLDYVSAYESCSSESEPSAAKISSIIETVREKNVPVVYYEELSTGKVADIICEETGAEKLVLHSCHNISAEDFDAGVTYFDLMEKNAENLKKGLN